MGLYNTFPIMFDSTTMPSPSKWQETSKVVENVNTTEAGTDQVEVVRYDKLTIDVTYKIAEATSNGIVKTLKEFSKQDSIAVKKYDVITCAYETRYMRIRNFKAQLKSKSDMLTAVNGVWEVSFTLQEF